MKRIICFLLLSVIKLSSAYATGIPVFDANTLLLFNKAIDQYNNMKDQLKAVTGNKGMGGIGIEPSRDYLPADWKQAMSMLEPGNPYKDITNQAIAIRNKQTVLTDQEFKKLPLDVQQSLSRSRDTAAIQQALGEAVYKKANQRLAILQQLVDKVSQTEDAKAAMDLQARIQSEQTMLQNEAIKVANLQQLQQAQTITEQTKQNEMRIQISGTGNFPRLNK